MPHMVVRRGIWSRSGGGQMLIFRLRRQHADPISEKQFVAPRRGCLMSGVSHA